VARALRGADGVVNCLSGSPHSITAGASAVLRATAPMDSAPLVVHLSSMSVYGAVRGDVAEDAPLQGDLGEYARAKIAAEALAAQCRRVVILRPGVEFGPACDLWSGRVARWLMASRIGDLGAAGDGICNLVYIDDLVDAILNALQRPEAVGGTFNLGMPDPPTWNDYFIAFARALGAVPVRRIGRRRLAWESKVLAPPLKILELAARRAGMPATLAPPIPPSFLRLAGQEIRLVSTRAQDVLGLRCTPLRQGLADTAAWFHNARGPGAPMPRR
jgi:nucleoside-diphosphate-sugar epimerase